MYSSVSYVVNTRNRVSGTFACTRLFKQLLVERPELSYGVVIKPFGISGVYSTSQPDLTETSARNQIADAQEFVRRMVQVLAKSSETQEDDRAGK